MASETPEEEARRKKTLTLKQVPVKRQITRLNNSWYCAKAWYWKDSQRVAFYGRTREEAERKLLGHLDQIFGVYGYRLEFI